MAESTIDAAWFEQMEQYRATETEGGFRWRQNQAASALYDYAFAAMNEHRVLAERLRAALAATQDGGK